MKCEKINLPEAEKYIKFTTAVAVKQEEQLKILEEKQISISNL